ncbi:MAG: glycosyltransferase, partial [Micromonosporaceae bacterium]|nr:glycosyltransferase [Micromonosporaceae bacterium]
SAVTLRAADLFAVVAIALVAAPGLAHQLAGVWPAVAAAVLGAAALGGGLWLARVRRDGAAIRLAPVRVLGLAFLAWCLEAAVVWRIAAAAGHPISVAEAIAVTAVTIVAQAVAVTPGGFGSYEAAATAALVALVVPAGQAFAIALTAHVVKTGYSLVVGGVALAAPAPAYWGRLRLPRVLPPRPAREPVDPDAPVVAVIPAHNEEETVADVVGSLPPTIAGRPLLVLVIDDGSTDATAALAAAAGAEVLAQPRNLGLGAAVRRGLAEAAARNPAAVVYLDADNEYFGGDAETVVAQVLAGEADYVIGSRFRGEIAHMRPHRRLGNVVLTRWVRWLTRRRDVTDGQSGYRAFSPEAAAAAEIIHDYNYAQVLTLDLLAKGHGYAEVPIRYRFRQTGTSFIKLGRYLRKVIPAVYRELNAAPRRS